MTISSKLKSLGLSERHQGIIEEFLKNIGWYDKDISKLQTTTFKKKVYEYARNHFDERESFITAMNGFMQCVTGTEDRFCKVDKIYNSTEFKIKLLKYLQGVGEGKRRDEIAEHFNVSLNTIDKRLSELQAGTNILGQIIRIELERGTNLYDSTAHPILLTLNLTEVYTLLVALKNLDQTLFSSPSRDLIHDIYSQLTDYAKEIIHHSGIITEEDLKEHQVGYTKRFRQETIKNRALTILKKGSKCMVLTTKTENPLKGILKINTGEDSSFFKMITEGGDTIPLNNEDIKDIIDLETDTSLLSN